VNYSLLVMETVWMMKMATSDGFPLWQGAGTAPDWFSMATEACGSGTHDLGFFLGVLGFIGIFGVGLTSRGSTRQRQGRSTLPRGRACPPTLSSPRDSSGP